MVKDKMVPVPVWMGVSANDFVIWGGLMTVRLSVAMPSAPVLVPVSSGGDWIAHVVVIARRPTPVTVTVNPATLSPAKAAEPPFS